MSPLAQGLCVVWVTKAVGRVVVYHAAGLHEGVANGGAYKGEATAFQVLAHGTRGICLGGHVTEPCPVVDARLTVDEAPNVGVKGAKLLLDA